MNLYVYCLNNPVNLTDPLGKISKECCDILKELVPGWKDAVKQIVKEGMSFTLCSTVLKGIDIEQSYLEQCPRGIDPGRKITKEEYDIGLECCKSTKYQFYGECLTGSAYARLCQRISWYK